MTQVDEEIQRLKSAIRRNKEEDAMEIGFRLLALALNSLVRIADAVEKK